ncbi:MAG: hypothetical protein EHM41_03090 [Chloroflexi bacterium]|nr:MAG: hypothetical protein EHM41_03090 [Chloroflexota bacterium]
MKWLPILKETNKKGKATKNSSTFTLAMEAQQQHPIQPFALQLKRFLLHFLEMQIPLGFGALVCFLLTYLLPASSGFATIYHPGSYLYAFGDVLFLTIPVVAWMIVRGHGWQRSLEMAVAMVVPVVAIMVLGQLVGYSYLLWLLTAMYPVMCLGMLVYMVYHRDYYTGRMGYSLHVDNLGGETSYQAD